ncbi:sodium:proton exchanger [Elioraea sp. Yellowstone]|uniref:cation:proton antiporter domain-containing protein n=1 Tax=Elioraea sp. Yellowstone TaxID=2592070 RepID=UPI00114D6E95|nr:cation:proton antiporter [Elioraea sp. Yellowstone]TQF78181.1 sodium:proton exchanger [Elioraea sp. Yellowstone]
MSVFQEVAALLAIASAVGLVGIALRQPLIVSFIAVGILVGPSGFGIVSGGIVIETLARLGIALLLFLVGLKLDIGLIRSFGRVALATGLGQVAFTSIGGFLICLALGMGAVEALYVAVALTFSSTIIIVKLLSDKREIDALHGRIALGFLIVQDICVVIAMIALSAFGAVAGEGGGAALARALGGGLALVAVAGLFMRYLAEPLLTRMAREPELLVVFAIGWAAVGAAAADAVGLSKELGGLLAGVSLGSTSVREAIAARLAPLRDFLLLFFFLELGALFDFSAVGGELARAAVLSVFVLVGNPLIVMAIMGVMGYRKRTGFLAGLTVAQISEFSLVFIALGHALGHVGPEAVGLTTLVGIVTIALSTYMIVHSFTLYRWCEPFLGLFERRRALREDHLLAAGEAPERPVILCGLGRYGTAIAERLAERGIGFLGVDFDPEAVRAFQRRGWPAIYGDITDPTFVAHLPLAHAAWVVVAVPHTTGVLGHADTTDALVGALRQAGFRGRIALTATFPGQAARLKALGAEVVLSPFADAADEAVQRLLAAAPPQPATA